MKPNALKVTVSGSYKTSNGEIVDFEDVSGIIPLVDEEHAKMHVRRRYASEWVGAALDDADKKLYPKRIDRMRQCWIDDLEETVHEFSYVGKDIKKMTYEELQDLATAKDLRTIPLPKKISGVDIREMRQKAYLEYSAKVLQNPIDEKKPLPEHASKSGDRLMFDFAKLPPLEVSDGEARVETAQKITNEEILDQEMKPQTLGSKHKDQFTLEQLKDLAKKKNVKHHWNIGFDRLYDMLFDGNAAA